MSATLPSEDNVNFFRLTSLLIDVGTDVLRRVLDYYCGATPLYQHLSANLQILTQLKNQKVITASQWTLLYPPAGQSHPVLKDFDITLIHCLLRNTFPQFGSPQDGWNKQPPSTDLSLPADLVRLKNYRNKIHGHCKSASLSSKDFNLHWHNLSGLIIGIAQKCPLSTADVQEIQSWIRKIALSPVDATRELELVQILQSWTNADVLQGIVDVENQMFQLRADLASSNTSRSEYQKVLVDKLEELLSYVEKEYGREVLQNVQEVHQRMAEMKKLTSDYFSSLNTDMTEIKREIKEVQRGISNEIRMGFSDFRNTAASPDSGDTTGLPQPAFNSLAQNVIDSTAATISHHKKRACFIRTKAFHALMSRLSTSNVAIVTGTAGNGKTSLILEAVNSVCAEGCNQCPPRHWIPVILRSPAEWTNIINVYKPFLVAIDDFAGASNFSASQFEAWLPFYDSMATAVREGNMKLMITSRKHILLSCLDNLKRFEIFKNENIVDMSSSNLELTIDEKKDILMKHLEVSLWRFRILPSDEPSKKVEEKEGSVYSMSHQTVNRIVKSSTRFGFPQCCRMFASSESIFLKGEKFFQKPLEFLLDDLGAMYGSAKEKYFTLVLAMFDGGTISLDKLDVFSLSDEQENKMKKIAVACGITWADFSLGSVQDACSSLEGSFLCLDEDESKYKFSHESIMEAVCLSFGQRYPKETLQICSLDFLTQYIRTPGCPKLEGELTIVLPKSSFPALSKRFIDEIANSNVEEIAKHKCMRDEAFLGVLFRSSSIPELLQTFLQSRDGLRDNTFLYWTIAQSNPNLALVQKFASLRAFFPDSVWRTDIMASALKAACWRGNAGIYRILVEAGAPITGNALIWSGIGGSAEITTDLIRNKSVDVNTKNEDSRTALHEAAWHGNLAVAKCLVDSGIRVNDGDFNECTALQDAAERGHPEVVKYLTSRAADVNAADKNKMTALLKAAREGHGEVVEHLLDCGADVNCIDSGRRTPLSWAAYTGQSGIVKTLLARGANANIRDNWGKFPFLYASVWNHLAIMDLLLDNTDFTFKDGHGNSVLHIASAIGYADACIGILKRKQSQLHLRNDNNWTPLHCASFCGKPAAVRVLVMHGADATATTAEGLTSLEFAYEGMKYQKNWKLLDNLEGIFLFGKEGEFQETIHILTSYLRT